MRFDYNFTNKLCEMSTVKGHYEKNALEESRDG